MARDVRLNKEVFDKRIYQKTIDTTFKELGVKTVQEQIDEQPTVQEFFDMYTELFYQINERGPDNSHEYLVKTSGEYISFEDKDELVEALQKEIANLRKELLQAQQDLADALGDLAEASQPLPEIEEVEASIENPVVDIINTPEPIQDSPPPRIKPSSDTPSQPNPYVEYINLYRQFTDPIHERSAYPISRNMLRENFEYINDNRKNDFPNDGSITRGATKLFLDTAFAIVLETVQRGENQFLEEKGINLNYKFARKSKLRDALKVFFKVSQIPGDDKIKENVEFLMEETIEQMQKHYNANKNFNEEGGFL